MPTYGLLCHCLSTGQGSAITKRRPKCTCFTTLWSRRVGETAVIPGSWSRIGDSLFCLERGQSPPKTERNGVGTAIPEPKSESAKRRTSTDAGAARGILGNTGSLWAPGEMAGKPPETVPPRGVVEGMMLSSNLLCIGRLPEFADSNTSLGNAGMETLPSDWRSRRESDVLPA